jgi:glycosyltransferase involved in cell wall biosynthesis
MVYHHPEHEYFFIFDSPYDPKYIFSDRITPIIIPPRARHPLLWYVWYEWSLPRILKKHKIDLFISTDGLGTLSSKIPSCTVIHDIAFEHFPEQVSFFTRKYYQHFIPRYVKHSSMLATVSEATKEDMVSRYKVDPNKVCVVESACPQHFQPQTDLIKQKIKKNYSNGEDFFVFVGAIHPRKNVLRIIEAFATFKKQHQTGMKLLLIGRKAWMTQEFEQALQNHPYQNDIVHLQNIDKDELSKIVGSAYASIYPSLLEGFGLPILEAHKSGVPIITSNCSAMPEVAGNAALLADPFDANDIAGKMGTLFENELLRKELIERGKQNWPRYSWDRTAELLYHCAMKIFKQ